MDITLKAKNRIQTIVKDVHKNVGNLTIQEFIDLHTVFIRDKHLEYLAHKTIEDHIYLVSLEDGLLNPTGLMKIRIKKTVS